MNSFPGRAARRSSLSATTSGGASPDKLFHRVIDRFVTDGANRARGVEGGEFDMANFVPLDEALRIGAESGFHLIEGNNLWAWPADLPQHGPRAHQQQGFPQRARQGF